MPSHSANKFKSRIDELMHLRNISTDHRIMPISQAQKQVVLHSYLAGVVATWDMYIKSLVKEFLQNLSNPLNVHYNSIYVLLNLHIEKSIGKFNTPNFENTRNLLIDCTGYDPFAHWIWTRRGFNQLQTKERMNEILKIRHSFAHGFSMQTYNWNSSPTGKTRLTLTIVNDVCALFKYLVLVTDQGIATTLKVNHGITVSW